ncbi:MAG: sigma-70 family RNA polymerase sigma factor [Planctomycetes bacterium]|nr:sigma-70 family RNA polymerase sigma factor [Planctomycetota bacterium]
MAQREDFADLALVHLDSVYRAAYALSGRHDEAEDLSQTTFAKAYEKFGQFAEGTNCKSWLLKILRNSWIDVLRGRRMAGPDVTLTDEMVVDDSEPAGSDWSEGRDVLEQFSDEEVISALKSLSPEQRLTLYLVEVEQLSCEEAAEVLGVAVGTVKSRTGRARSALRSRLANRARELGMTGENRWTT